jgi:hypothetical protein
MYIGTEVVLANLTNVCKDGVTNELLNRYSIKLSRAIVEQSKIPSVCINVDANNINDTLDLYGKYFYAQNGRYYCNKEKLDPSRFNSKFSKALTLLFVTVAQRVVANENI